MRGSKWMAVAASLLLWAAPVLEAEAKRLGGGLNIGRTAAPARATPPATPPKQAQPAPQAAQPQAAQTAAARPATAASQQAARSSWMGPLAGIAAGLGLAALAAYLGFSQELMSILLIVLAAVLLMALFRRLGLFGGRRSSAQGVYGQPAMARSGYGGADLGAEARPGHVFTPASGGSVPDGGLAAGAAGIGASAPLVSQPEIDRFISAAREQFMRLQSIWDTGDIYALSDFCTADMTRELSHQIAARKGAANETEIMSLNVHWVGMNLATDDFGKPVDEVQIRFSGLVREESSPEAVDFDEIWTLQRQKETGAGWLLAGIAQMR